MDVLEFLILKEISMVKWVIGLEGSVGTGGMQKEHIYKIDKYEDIVLYGIVNSKE